MKIKFLLPIFCFLVFSCSSDDSDEDSFIGTIVERNFEMRNTELLRYDLGEFGEKGSATIIVQAENSKTSQIVGTVYNYEPEDGYVGQDYVEISSSVINEDTLGNDVVTNTRTRITIVVLE